MNEDEMYPSAEDAPSKPEPSDKEEGGETFLVPKSTLGEKKPGDKCRFEIVAAYDDEYEVKYLDSEKEEEKPEESSINQEIDAAAMKGDE